MSLHSAAKTITNVVKPLAKTTTPPTVRTRGAVAVEAERQLQDALDRAACEVRMGTPVELALRGLRDLFVEALIAANVTANELQKELDLAQEEIAELKLAATVE